MPWEGSTEPSAPLLRSLHSCPPCASRTSVRYQSASFKKADGDTIGYAKHGRGRLRSMAGRLPLLQCLQRIRHRWPGREDAQAYPVVQSASAQVVKALSLARTCSRRPHRDWSVDGCAFEYERSVSSRTSRNAYCRRRLSASIAPTHSLARIKSTTQQPRTCGPSLRQWLRMSSAPNTPTRNLPPGARLACHHALAFFLRLVEREVIALWPPRWRWPAV